MRLWSKMVDEGLHEGVTEISFSAMFRERMKAMPADMREARFRNIGDPRRRDRFKSTYELGVRSPFVLHGIAAYERAFGLLEEALAESGPWLVGDEPDARRYEPDALCGAARLSRPHRPVDRYASARAGLVGAGARMAELQVGAARSASAKRNSPRCARTGRRSATRWRSCIAGLRGT